jgi:large subunit ribosomal protein L10
MATSLEGKKKTVGIVQELLHKSEMVFTVPGDSFTVAQLQILRRAVPTSTTIKIVKNTLMNRAIENTPYDVASSILSGSNLWFFIEDDIGGTIKSYNAFLKQVAKLDTHAIKNGVIEGTVYDSAGVTAIGQLPSKKELYGQIAGAIQEIPTKVARVIKAPSSKLARAIKLATDEIHKE